MVISIHFYAVWNQIKLLSSERILTSLSTNISGSSFFWHPFNCRSNQHIQQQQPKNYGGKIPTLLFVRFVVEQSIQLPNVVTEQTYHTNLPLYKLCLQLILNHKQNGCLIQVLYPIWQIISISFTTVNHIKGNRISHH